MLCNILLYAVNGVVELIVVLCLHVLVRGFKGETRSGAVEQRQPVVGLMIHSVFFNVKFRNLLYCGYLSRADECFT